MSGYRPQRVADDAVNRNLESISQAIDAASRNVLGKSATIVTARLAANQETQVYHGLSRVPVGWAVVRKDAFADVRDTGILSRSALNLVASSDVNLSLLVW